jgi:DNA polymerase-1
MKGGKLLIPIGNPECEKCGLCRTASTVNIMGVGPIPAKFMVVTDMPGWAEDEKGVPLTGKGKDMLYSMLKEAGINPKECYFTNAVKCRTPEGRAPKAAEMKECREYLDGELAVVKPKYVLLLGSTSYKMMLGSGKITDDHGKIVEKNGVKYMPSFSPWIAFRDPKRAEPLKADLMRFGNMLKGVSSELPKLNLRYVKNFNDVNEMLDEISENTVVSFDVETTSLKRHFGHINLLGIGLQDSQWILPLEWHEGSFKGKSAVIRQILELIAEALKGKKVVGQNGKFDNLWLKHHYGVKFPLSFDTMIAAYALNENRPTNLNYLTKVFLNWPGYDISTEEKVGNTSLKKLSTYLGYDVYGTRALYFILRDLLKKDRPTARVFKLLLMPAARAYENIEEAGMYIYPMRFDEVDKHISTQMEKVLAKLHKFKVMNWGSTKQVGEFLFGDLKLPILESTKGGSASTGESVLMRLRDQHPCIDLLLEYKGLKQQHSFFIAGWKKRMHKGMLYPSFKLAHTVTGRTSCEEPNLQQVPRDPVIRSLIGAPKGWTHVQLDYSQVELRVVAMISGEPTMKWVFQTGQDIHTKTAQDISGNPKPSKEERKQAKAVNFGFVYGMGWRKFKDYARDKYGVILTDAQAKTFRKRFFESYSGLMKWHAKQRKIVGISGQVRNLIGRLRRLPEIYSPDQGMKAEAERQAINSPVQSFASDMTLMSIIQIDKEIPKEDAVCFGSVHDAILFRVRDEVLEETVMKIKSIMESPKLLKTFGVNMTVPIIADMDIGDWGKGVSLDEWKAWKKSKTKKELYDWVKENAS